MKGLNGQYIINSGACSIYLSASVHLSVSGDFKS